MTPLQLRHAWGVGPSIADAWAGLLSETMAAFDINTPARQAAALAQFGHESGRGRYVREIWGNPPTRAQAGYEGRRDLGNTRAGDGKRYMGRGLIQNTGRANYAAARDGLRKLFPDAPDFEAEPQMLETPRWAALSAGWFWNSRHLNELADAGNFMLITRRINGGTNGYIDRLALWDAAKAALRT